MLQKSAFLATKILWDCRKIFCRPIAQFGHIFTYEKSCLFGFRKLKEKLKINKNTVFKVFNAVFLAICLNYD
jgi:hypothetical protein